MTDRRIIPILAILTLLGVLIISCGGEQNGTPGQQPPVAVQAFVIDLADEVVTRTYTGTLEGEKQAVIYAKIAEAVQAVHVEEGEAVTAGQVLLSLDRSGPSSRYQEAYSLYRNAEKNFKKMEYLYKEGAVSEARFDAASTEYEVTRAGFEAAAQLVEIQSPIDGIVTSVAVSKGDYLTPGQQLATVATIDRLRVELGVNPSDIADIAPGTTVEVSHDGATMVTRGRVASVARSADPLTRTFKVEVLINNVDNTMRPGLFVRADIPLENLAGVIAVPQQALIARADRQTVFVVVGCVAHERQVTTGADLGGRIVITSGLNPGDTLVTLGQDYLRDGSRVKLTDLIEGSQ